MRKTIWPEAAKFPPSHTWRLISPGITASEWWNGRGWIADSMVGVPANNSSIIAVSLASCSRTTLYPFQSKQRIHFILWLKWFWWFEWLETFDFQMIIRSRCSEPLYVDYTKHWISRLLCGSRAKNCFTASSATTGKFIRYLPVVALVPAIPLTYVGLFFLFIEIAGNQSIFTSFCTDSEPSSRRTLIQ